MSDKRYIVAFEIGSSKIKGAVGVVDTSGTLNVLAVEEEQLVDSVRYGCIRKAQDVAQCIQRIATRLEACPALSPGKIKGCYVSLGGQSLMSSQTTIERKFSTETEITESLIRQIKEQARATGVPDRDTVAVLAREFVVGALPQRNPVGTFTDELKAKLTMLYCRPQLKDNLNRVFSERLPIAINGYVIRQLAIASLVLTDEEKHLGCMLVDFGAETTTVSIYKNGALRYLATIPMGSRNITRDLTALNCVEKRAEEIKKVIGDVDPSNRFESQSTFEGLDNTEINNYINARAGEIITNIIEQLTYASVKADELPSGIVIVGGGAKLRGFNELLSTHSKMKVRRGSVTGPVRVSEHVNATDSIDVISLLAIASKLPPKQSVEFPVVVTPADEDDGDDNVSRIGMDDDDDFSSLENDDDDPHARRSEKKNDSRKSDRPRSRSFLEIIRGRVMNYLNEDNDDFYSDKDNDEK